MTDDIKDMLADFSTQYGVTIPDGLPPCSLKEIYQLPHKGKGKDEEEEKDEGKKKTPENQLNIAELLNVQSTEHMKDVSMNERSEV